MSLQMVNIPKSVLLSADVIIIGMLELILCFWTIFMVVITMITVLFAWGMVLHKWLSIDENLV